MLQVGIQLIKCSKVTDAGLKYSPTHSFTITLQPKPAPKHPCAYQIYLYWCLSVEFWCTFRLSITKNLSNIHISIHIHMYKKFRNIIILSCTRILNTFTHIHIICCTLSAHLRFAWIFAHVQLNLTDGSIWLDLPYKWEIIIVHVRTFGLIDSSVVVVVAIILSWHEIWKEMQSCNILLKLW